MCRNMLKPGVTMRSMPVLYSLWYIYYITWLQRNGRFAPFLIPTLAADADEDLVCAVVDVPVVATSWFEGHIAVALHGLLFGREILGLDRCKTTVAREILGKWVLGLPLGQSPWQASAALSDWERPFSER